MESVQQLRDAAVKPDDAVLYECLCDSTVSRAMKQTAICCSFQRMT